VRDILNRFIRRLSEGLSRAGIITLLIIIAFFAFLFLRYGGVIIYAVLIEIAIALIITLSLNLETGVTGLSQFGRVIAIIAGAYMVGGICGRLVALFLGLPSGPEYADFMLNYRLVTEINNVLRGNPGLSIAVFIMYLVLAAAAGAFLGYLTSRPAIRLRGPFLGISLLAFGDALMYWGTNWWPLVGGTQAIHIPDPFRFLEELRFQVLTILSLGIAILILLVLEMIDKSPLGRTFRALRDSEVVSDVYGKDIVRMKTISLMMGSAKAAIGGAI
jgi:branched-chain amino acid transport system permease protein